MAVIRDRESGDEVAAGARRVGEAAVVRDDHPARRGAAGRHRCADRRERPVPRQGIRRHRSLRFRRDRLIMRSDIKAECRASARRRDRRRAECAGEEHGEHLQPVAHPLGDDEIASVVGEAHGGRAVRASGEGVLRVWQRNQDRADPEEPAQRVVVGVEDVEQGPTDGEADRPGAAGGDAADANERAVVLDVEARHLIAPRVDGEQRVVIVGEHHRILRRQRIDRAARASAAGGEGSERRERAVVGTMKCNDAVAADCIRQCIHGAAAVPVVATIVAVRGGAGRRRGAHAVVDWRRRRIGTGGQ